MRYKGATKTKTGANKRTVANEISVLLRRHGLLREGAAIIDKIARIVSSFNRAKDWERNTGRGLLQTAAESFEGQVNDPEYLELVAQNEKTIEDAKLNLCKYYNELCIVLEDKPLSTPIYHASTGDSIDLTPDDIFDAPSDGADNDVELPLNQGSPPRSENEAIQSKPSKKKLKLSNETRQKSFGETIASALEGQGSNSQRVDAIKRMGSKPTRKRGSHKDKRDGDTPQEGSSQCNHE
ncbi:hypothetical protein Ae201684P_012873 [Aphanomyces euteiches]|nr:hypothetical protein Ae201684P_012873 [Aphanomyces euteiches]KAH9144858.1 hypothetical protein AeRB84_011204 [Aphanomyces euteiches]